MKKIILFFAALFFVTVATQSQVKIGKDAEPEKGAILDLNADAGYKGGLLLPNVDITNVEQIPADFTESSVKNQEDNAALTGMIVWNTHLGSEGVYMWDGAKWNPIGSPGACTSAPSDISINGFTGTYKPNIEFELTCSVTDAGNAVYVWSVPTGLTVVSGEGTSTLRVKGSSVGLYSGNSINCLVANACGYGSGTSLTELFIDTCSAAPVQPETITLSATAVQQDSTFTASVPAVAGALAYVWTLPSGLTTTSLTTAVPAITIKAVSVGGYAAGTIKVTVKTGCGSSTNSNAQAVCVSLPGEHYTCVIGQNGSTSYNVYCYDDSTGLGCWMIDNSQEGNPSRKGYPSHASGERGYYYTPGELATACPPGYELPLVIDWLKVDDYLKNTFGISGANWWYREYTLAGYAITAVAWYDWNSKGMYQTSENKQVTYSSVWGLAPGTTTSPGRYAAPVRCVKE